MAATAYDDKTEYLPFLKKGKKKKSGCGCGGSSKEDCTCKDHEHEECGCEEKKDCGCCPPGLVAVIDEQGHHVGCLTPNDAELYNKNTLDCGSGYVKLINNATGAFLGCVSEDQFPDLYSSVNQ